MVGRENWNVQVKGDLNIIIEPSKEMIVFEY